MILFLDFKVDVHRKNSSESSDSLSIFPKTANQNSIITYNAEICATVNHRKEENIKNRSNKSEHDTNEFKEVVHKINEKDVASSSCEVRDRRVQHELFDKNERKCKSAHSKLQRQISLDSEKMPIDCATRSSKLQRHRSTEGHEERHIQKNKSNVSLILPAQLHQHHHHSASHHNHSRIQSLASDLYLENNYTTKSELAIENIPSIDHHISNKNFSMQKSTPMRRDSNSTMSALQLPITSSSTSTRNRRHSNAANNTSVRRIKSAALEICQQSSTSNLGPHPNSVEAIAGQIIRNPQTSLFPLPSKTLSRNPHLNLFPKSGQGNFLISTNNLNSTVDPVYPIEEQADEGGCCATGRSVSDEFSINQNSESDDGDDEDSHGTHSHQNQRQSITESESDLDRLQLQSTDSDTENNGSRSPLLEVRDRVPIFVLDKSGTGANEKFEAEIKIVSKQNIKKDILAKQSDALENANEDSEGPSTEGEQSEQASGGSKDLLLTEKDVPQYITLNFNIFSDNIDESAFASFHPDGTPADMPVRNLGAIPKAKLRSTASSRRFSTEEHCRPARNIALPRHFWNTNYFDSSSALASTSGASTSPISHIPSYSNILNSRSGTIEHQTIPVSTQCLTTAFQPRARSRRLPSYAVLEPIRHRQPKIRRSTRQKHQRSSVDSCQTSKDNLNTTQSQIDYSGNSHRFLEDSVKRIIASGPVFPYDMIPADRLPVQSGLLSINRVDFNENNFPDFGRHFIATEKPVQPKRYYKFPINFLGKTKQIKISMDRLQLLALFDRDSGWIQVYLAIILAIFVAILGALVLNKEFYSDIYAFIFCFVIASSQYSLLKSVQPDAASPIHGFNKTVSFSRPIYFCLCTGLMLLSHRIASESNNSTKPITLFGIACYQREFFLNLQYILSIMLLAFPIFFSLGLFPQINTFIMYLLEQIDMHVFGGNAVCSLASSFISILRSIVACLILYGPAFGGLSEVKKTQNVLFSIFCALIISISYHLSRSASDFSCIWNLIKSSLIFHPDDEEENSIQDINNISKKKSCDNDEKSQSKNYANSNFGSGDGEVLAANEKTNTKTQTQYEPSQTNKTNPPPTLAAAHQNHDESDIIMDPLPKKLQSTVNIRLKNDVLICSFLGVTFMALHSSTIFNVLQPDLNIVLYAVAIVIGILLHYIIPQMRKHLPWLCIARPILRQYEYGQFEATEASRVMWFESTYIIISFFEKNILYPLIFLSSLTADSEQITNKYGIHLGTAIIVIAGLKCMLKLIFFF